jgi:hypothetical protein
MIRFYNKKDNLKIIGLFMISIIFYLKVLKDITWFEDELQGHWLLKRIVFSALLSFGYLTQHIYFKSHFPKICKSLLVLTLIVSALCSVLGGLDTIFIFLLIIGVLLSLSKKNAVA